MWRRARIFYGFAKVFLTLLMTNILTRYVKNITNCLILAYIGKTLKAYHHHSYVDQNCWLKLMT